VLWSAVPLNLRLLRVRDWMDRAYAEPLDVELLARYACLSRAQFNRTFKRAFNETPHQYLLSRRMERAKALLRAGDMSVTDVCLAVGFTSLGSFSTQFRRLVGESPTAYRERAAQWNRTLARVPSCLQRKWTRPRVERFREADQGSASLR
jgi:transcriptional regulator GlxA family with amidase domain